MAMLLNLNDIGIPSDMSPEPQRDNGTSAIAKVEAIFKNHRGRLVREVSKSSIVLGCIAWLTDIPVLRALSKCQHVTIIVQKEDFLRPDLGRRRANDLRSFYDNLPSLYERYQLPGPASGLSYSSDSSLDAVRCVGNHNREKQSAWPRMHNKFLVFCDAFEGEKDQEQEGIILKPRRVWTGSYNISKNATASWENAVLIESDEIASAYANEFGQILAFSEKLDWTSDWVEPEYRIGS